LESMLALRRLPEWFTFIRQDQIRSSCGSRDTGTPREDITTGMKVIGLNYHMTKRDGWRLATMDTGILSDTGKAIIVGTNIDTVGIKNVSEIIIRVVAMATERSTEMLLGLQRLYNGFCKERTKKIKPLAKLRGFNRLV